MGKLMNKLQAQLLRPEDKEDAKECIEIYNWIKDTDKDGRVWASRWRPLVNVTWLGSYPNSEARYSLNITGKNLLKGIGSK